ncbi:deleted in malignant brain tumors 1 protein-like [Hemiscyllium ocellatum]|uniref:deleted in malignant brain tumors 1 protein-like n=1 Tax=Hemiscyllium ocellatum TaxID=170820 RepID=UPI002965E497|nr:deleted in malignant brain tumors 1 protein-like [Hemiscyllium ocellatum]
MPLHFLMFPGRVHGAFSAASAEHDGKQIIPDPPLSASLKLKYFLTTCLEECRFNITQEVRHHLETVRLRLENGGSPCAGRVGIHYDRLWGTVDDDKWDLLDASVVCRELDCGSAVSAPRQAYFGEGSGPIMTWNFECNGTERALRDCQSERWGHYTASYTNNAGVICSDHILPRLVPGSAECFGSLEVQFGDTWKTVCGLDWDLKNANVVCAQLHCGVAVSVSSSAHSGGGNVLMASEVIQCTGNETHLGKCPRSPANHQDCSVHNNVTLICSGRPVDTQANSTETVSLRLENGDSPCAGRVEIHFMSLWGTVHDDYWDMDTATVVCRELDCGIALSAPLGPHFGEGSGPIVTGGFWCKGTERTLQDCPSYEWGHYTNPHSNDAGVICSEQVMLVPENSQCHGRLEVLFEDTWKTVCGLDWDLKNANVVCAQLHCGAAVSVSSSAHSGGSTVLMGSKVFECTGNETQLGNCRRSSTTHFDCNRHNNVTLICSGNHGPRLVGGKNRCSGRVEVLHGEQWGTLCGDFFDSKTASVVCEHLQCGTVKSIHRDDRFGRGAGPVWTYQYNCHGNARRLWDCPISQGEMFNCSHGNIANVICSGVSDDSWSPRLVNGRNRCDGQVEVYYNGSWGRVQDSLWDLNAAHVVCRQLGCGYALETHNSSNYVDSNERPLMHGIQCHGQESQIRDCNISNSLKSSVTDRGGVGILCSEHIQLRLSDGGTRCAGRLEIYYKGTWGSVCDDSWDVRDAEVVCKQLGCGGALERALPSSCGPGTGPVWLKDVNCSGNESFLWECPSAPFGQQDDCSHKEDVRIMCSGEETLNGMRLVNGKHRCEGRVEVFYNEAWGTVCSESLDFHDGEVICKQLQCGALQSIDYYTQLFGAGTGPIWLDEVECLSHEPTLWQCKRNPWGQHNCEHREDAGVVCSGKTTNLKFRLSFQKQISNGVNMFFLFTETNATKEQSLNSSSCHQQAGQARASISIPGIICLTLAVLLICDVIALLVVMQRKYQRKGRYTGGSSLGLYQGIYEEIADIPPVKQTSEKHGPVISASVGSVNRIEYYTSHGFGDNNLGSDDLEVNANRNWAPVQGHYDDIETESQDGQSQLESNADESLALTNADDGLCSLEEFRLRLENGSTRCAGRLEIEFRGQRITVNANDWDLTDATVVCRQLNCGSAVSALGGAHFGPGSGPIEPWPFECNGTEHNMFECPPRLIANSNTSHDDDIGVICSGHVIPRLVPD